MDAPQHSLKMEDFTWQFIHNYFSESGGWQSANPLVQHQIESYNEFIDKKLSQIIQGFNPIQICHHYKESVKDFAYKIFLTVHNPSLSKPIIQSQDGSQQLMTPHLARMNSLTYSVNLYVDIHILTETINQDNITERQEIKVPNVVIGKIPIMVKSKACVLNMMPGLAENEGKHECRYDPGGYFIVNGNEKVVISQDRISENKTLVFSASGCVTEGLTAEIRSVPDGVFLPPKTTSLHLSSKPNHLGRIIRLNSSFLRSEVPVFVMFRALGITSDKDILQHVLLDMEHPKHQRIMSELVATVEDASEIHTQEEAIQYLMKYVTISGTPKEYLEQPNVAKKVVMQIIQHDFIPHVGTNLKRKALYLGSMIKKIMNIYLGYQLPDNRDSYLHKRIDTPGILLSNLFRQCYGKMVKEMRTAIQRELQLWRATPNIPGTIINASNIHRFFKQSIIEMGIRYALSTGNWGVKSLGSFQNIRTGVAQVLNRMSYLSTLSHLRRINTPMEKNGKLVQPRKLENSQFGMVCLAETPEGSSVGLVKNMALSTKITISSTSQYIRELIHNLGTIIYDDSITDTFTFLKKMGNEKSVLIQINGDITGYHTNPLYFYDSLKSMKRSGHIPPTTSISWDVPENIIVISTEAGRMCRPLYIVDKKDGTTRQLRFMKFLDEDPEFFEKMKHKNFMEYLANLHENKEGFIEYMDSEEIDKAMVAMMPTDLQKTPRNTWIPPLYTHCEIHPSLMMGVLACNIPFSDHNQSPRNCYQSAMGKQAVGIYMSNFNNRIDTLGHILNYPQKPLARTKLAKYTNSDYMPSGVNAVIAIMTKTGFNQEDSVMVNKSALDRGLFTSTYYKAYKDQCSKNHSTGEEEQFVKPSPTTSHMKPYNYGKLDENGFVPINTYVNDSDILVGKVMPHKVQGQVFPRDMSMVMKTNDHGYVDMNYQGVNGEGYKFAKIRIRKYRKPTIGDKVSSRHGQKGTIGMIYNQEDMPFSKNGITPDVIVNPHAIPSRMTVGQLIECIMGKAACCLGAQGDATPFNNCTVEDLADILESNGMERYGNEILYNGRTGEMIHTEIFIGPTFYQRLKHMVSDKMHCLRMDHEILTDSGWKFYNELKEEDKVATLVNGHLVYEKPLEYHYYTNYKGKMYHISNSSIDLDVTDEHRMWMASYNQSSKSWNNYTLEKTKNIIGKYRRYQKDAIWEVPDYQLILPEFKSARLEFKEFKVPMHEWLLFFGIWMAEGYVYKDSTNYYRIEIAANKKRVKDALMEVEKSMNINFTKTKQSTQSLDDNELHRYCLTHQQIAHYLHTFSVGSSNKYLPNWVWQLSSTQCQTLIHGLMLGDGTWSKSGTQIYHTSSNKLADDFQKLCLHAGWCANKKLHIKEGTTTVIRGQEVITKHDSYRITVVKKYAKPSVNHGHAKRQGFQKEYVYDYEGPVFCLSVTSEVFMVRRNGKAVWSGNSRGSNGPVVKHRHSGYCKIPASLRYGRQHNQIAGTTWKSIVPRVI